MTGLQRKTPLSRSPIKRKTTRKCKVCRQEFAPWRPGVKVCGEESCMHAYALSVAEKSAAKRAKEAAKAERASIKARKEKIKRWGEWMAEAQQAVNAFRRNYELSIGSGCISCERTQEEVNQTDGWKPGGAWDAGHFIGVGANPTIRLEPKNIWLQCKSCNAGSAKYAKKAATVAKSYRANLAEREGIELVEWLEGPHEPKKYTIVELKEVRDYYRAALRELKKGMA